MTRFRTGRPLVLSAVLVLLSATTARAQASFTSLTFFGDSYSDTGNAHLLAPLVGLPDPTPSPPYFSGRFSNGPVWVDDLARLLGRPGDAAPVFFAGAPSGNYAVGGARTVNTGPVPPESPSTQFQIGRYLDFLASTGQSVDPTGLYVLFAGGNDMRDIGGVSDDATRQAETIAAATNVVTQAGALATAGARSILVPSLGDVGFLPESQMNGHAGVLHGLSPLFNATLATGLTQLRAVFPTTTFFDLRVDDLFASVLADAQAGGTRYGITNVAIPCFAPGAPSCDVSLFVDTQHPTARGHQILANAAFLAVGGQVAAVPEPATAALVGGGLVVLVVGMRRRGGAARGA